MTRLAVIGLGHRAAAMIGSMQAVDPGVSIRAVADPDTENARRRLAMVGPTPAGAQVYPSADAMLEEPADYDGVVIGTRCHLHTTMAIKVASAGLPLFLERLTSLQTHSSSEPWATKYTFTWKSPRIASKGLRCRFGYCFLDAIGGKEFCCGVEVAGMVPELCLLPAH
jgi:hypothetical protein